jgi:predicted nucleotidyltransferase component of viral defense system
MLDRNEIAEWAAKFGVSPDQVIKDHLISHLLFGLSNTSTPADLIFCGGTALSRTYLTELRLSEDIDLWTDNVASALAAIERDIPRAVRREFPSLTVEAAGTTTRMLSTRSGVQVRMQVLAYSTEYRRCIEHGPRDVVLRYADLPGSTEMAVPSVAGFAAMKHLAWVDRAAPRDLVDLMGLAKVGGLDRQADSVINCLRGFGVRWHELAEVPTRTRTSWDTDLRHQMSLVPDPEEALDEVREGWARSLKWSITEE